MASRIPAVVGHHLDAIYCTTGKPAKKKNILKNRHNTT